MEKLSFKKFMESDSPHPYVQNALRTSFGITKDIFPQALKGMFPTVDAQLFMPAGTGKKGKLQASLVPVDWDVKPNSQGEFQYMAKYMGKESPYIYFSDMDIVKPKDQNLYTMPKDVDNLMFKGQNLPTLPAKKKGTM